jgi:type IV pilus assembly protein PilB
MYNFTPESAKELIDKYLSLQWCKDNLIIPISIESNSNKDIFWVAIANYSYLGVLSDFIKHRIKQDSPNIEIIFIEKSFEEIEEMLEKASDLDK